MHFLAKLAILKIKKISRSVGGGGGGGGNFILFKEIPLNREIWLFANTGRDSESASKNRKTPYVWGRVDRYAG